ncbi:hypothetical protein PF005_g26966 [Phytophthora fragariae]|uniref:Uncharacterized protein n=1 Tax=Phytophthora fragariae TaxID=53985 RepID=A0A6A3DUP0_9STRA|nr:hypothetical protein PF003_g16163 [Phytophthora fragariae]KAE8922140.1 hypothetical protein PF009_g27590 [Phytophthora fragariae]KAE8995851.1 hypothetical protein PF011_g16149 [Phytophthora fragariae]KAE9069781.1 hypothetical protein PF010_g26538 [Phytophthora fragariae]KAE9070319.1 hypothetical protein PF007_g26982 [Phytophthora fragariae]
MSSKSSSKLKTPSSLSTSLVSRTALTIGAASSIWTGSASSMASGASIRPHFLKPEMIVAGAMSFQASCTHLHKLSL